MAKTSFNGATLSIKIKNTGEAQVLPGLQNIPDLGGTPNKIDITCLDDEVTKSIPGIQELGDMAFTFFNDDAAESAENILFPAYNAGKYDVHGFELKLANGTTYTFTGQIALVQKGGGINTAATFDLNVYLESDITRSNASKE